ncbi:FeoB small GTPase domain-containing protein [uncultured Methanolobus sp.]|uniref:FeoB small GTPase domain-containing protein n=1 Tax=uncultured Methanolobus sp. TaxID=218300 RepID=UPI0029C7DF47|nr:FeoB small GTPase domain-containing protein [uncultured Methanolobus sp.]
MLNILKKKSCCNVEGDTQNGLEKIILVGNPNVGKSVIFNYFSDSYAVVSNYPGTTVAVSKGKGLKKRVAVMLKATPKTVLKRSSL